MAAIIAACLMVSISQCQVSFIRGYDIDDSGDFGKDCEIISGSVTGKSRFNDHSNKSLMPFLVLFIIEYSDKLSERE